MPKKLRLESLSVAGFRGALEPRTLRFNGKSIALFGENGTGKSTFVDALEQILTGRVSTLDGRAQGISSQEHGRHIRAGGCAGLAEKASRSDRRRWRRPLPPLRTSRVRTDVSQPVRARRLGAFRSRFEDETRSQIDQGRRS